tara:strand:- start:16 stop:219 length:204 start_codon:yes stop_codon:yes gene_type:complete
MKEMTQTKELQELLELKADTNEGTFSIGNFYIFEDAKKAMLSDKNSENPTISLSGEVEYIWGEEIIG